MESIKLKQLPIACRYVPYDQWFVTHIDPSWKIKHLKQRILAKCHNLSFDPRQIPASEGGPSGSSARPPSPITFAPPRNSTVGDLDGELGMNGRDSPIRFATVNTRNPLSVEGIGSGDELDMDDSSTDDAGENRRPTGDTKLEDHDDGYDEDNEWEEADGPGPGGRVAVPGKNAGTRTSDVASPGASNPQGFNALRVGGPGAVRPMHSSGGLQVSIHPRHAQHPQIQTHAFTLIRFSTGQILEDEMIISWYDITPHELVELHFSIPPADFRSSINLVPLIIFGPSNVEADGSTGGKKGKHRATPSQNANILGIPAFDPAIMGFPPINNNNPSSAYPSQGADKGAASVVNRRTLTSLPRSNPNAYVQPYWEGWVRALRLVLRPDIVDMEAASRINYGNFGMLGGEVHVGPVPPPKSAHVEEKKSKSKLEWRERWVVIKDGIVFLCKDREDLEPTHRLPLSYLITLKGAEHLVQSISKNSRTRDRDGRVTSSGRDAVNDKNLRPPTRTSSPMNRPRGASDAGLISPTSRNYKGKGRETDDQRAVRRRSISPRSRDPPNAGVPIVRLNSEGLGQQPSSSSTSRPPNATTDPQRTASGSQIARRRPLTEGEKQKLEEEAEKRRKQKEEERKRRQDEREQLEYITRWDDIGLSWGKKDKDKERDKAREKEKEREKRDKREREDERRKDKDQLRSRSEREREKDREDREKEREREREREREKERGREHEREKERERERIKQRDREKQKMAARRHDQTYIPASTEEAEAIGMKIVCAKFKIVRKPKVNERDNKPDGTKYFTTGPSLAGDPPLPPPVEPEAGKKETTADDSFLAQRKASLPHLGLNFLTTTAGPSSSHPSREGGAVKFGLPGIFGKDKDKKDKKDKKPEHNDNYEDDDHAATTGLGWKLGRRKRGGGDPGSDFEVVSMPAALERPATSGEPAKGPTATIGSVITSPPPMRPMGDLRLDPSSGRTIMPPLPPPKPKPQRPAVVTTSLEPRPAVTSDTEAQNMDVEFNNGQELNSPTSDSMSLSSPVFAHSSDDDNDSLDNEILGAPRKAWGDRGDRKGYRYGGYHSSGPVRGKEKERDPEETENDQTRTVTSSTHPSSQPSRPLLTTTHSQPPSAYPSDRNRLAPPQVGSKDQPRQPSASASTQTLKGSYTSGRKREEDKGEWIVLDMGSDHAFSSILRIFHRHFPPPIESTFAHFLQPSTSPIQSSLSKDSTHLGVPPSSAGGVSPSDAVQQPPRSPEAIHRSTNASVHTADASIASTGNENSLNMIPTRSLALPYPEWRMEVLTKARTHGMKDAFRPLDLASRGYSDDVNDEHVNRTRKTSDIKVSSKAYAHLRRMSAQSRGIFPPPIKKGKSKGGRKKSRAGKRQPKIPEQTDGEVEGSSLNDTSTLVSANPDDGGSLADEDNDDEEDEYDEDGDDDRSSGLSDPEDNISLTAPMPAPRQHIEEGPYGASDADSPLGTHEDNVFSLASFEDSEEESEMEWAAWQADLPRQTALTKERKANDLSNTRSNPSLLKSSYSSSTIFSDPFGGNSSPSATAADLHRESWTPRIHVEEMRYAAENRRNLEPFAVGMSRSSSEAYGQAPSSPYHYGYPYYSEGEYLGPRAEKSLDSLRNPNYASDSPSYGSQAIDIARSDPTYSDLRGSQSLPNRRSSTSSTESVSVNMYQKRLNATAHRNQSYSPDSPLYDLPPVNTMRDEDEIPPVPPVPDEYLSQSPRSPTFSGVSPTKSNNASTPRHMRQHSRSLSGAIGGGPAPHGSHPPLSPSSRQASGLAHSASFHTPSRNDTSGPSSSRTGIPILSPEQISRIENETDERKYVPNTPSSFYGHGHSSRGTLNVYDSYSASTGSRTANTSSVSVNNPYAQTTSSQMFDTPPIRVKIEQATTTTTTTQLHASTSYPSMIAARSAHLPSTPSNPTSAAANVLQSAGRGIVSLIHGNIMPRRSSSAGVLGKPNAMSSSSSAQTPAQEGPSVSFASSPSSSLGRAPSFRMKPQGQEKERGPNVLRKRLSDLNRDRPPIPSMSSSPPNPTFMSPRQRPKLSLPGIHNSPPPPRDVAEPTSPRLQQARSPTSTTMGINSPLDRPSAGPWSTVETVGADHFPNAGIIAPVPVHARDQSATAMASARALLRRVRSGSSLHMPMGMHMEEPGSPETPRGKHSRSP